MSFIALSSVMYGRRTLKTLKTFNMYPMSLIPLQGTHIPITSKRRSTPGNIDNYIGLHKELCVRNIGRICNHASCAIGSCRLTRPPNFEALSNIMITDPNK
jgi:hypothetical protein